VTPFSPDHVEHLAAILKAVSGFVLSADKHYLIEPRLAPVARRCGMGSVEQVWPSFARLRMKS
jgi:chemotaxis protein methyltransferase CheR